MAEADALRQAGSIDQSLQLLETLNSRFPNDPRIMLALGRTYLVDGDAFTATVFLEQVLNLDPQNTDLLMEVSEAHLAADNEAEAAGFLMEIADSEPQRLETRHWFMIGRHQAAQDKVQPALDAYLTGIGLQEGEADPETAAAIGDLFLKSDNLPLAETWYTNSTEATDPPLLPALFGLLEVRVRQQDWKQTATTIEQIDEAYPGALDASQWATARSELQQWEEAQATMRAELAAAKSAEAAAAEAAEPETAEGDGRDAPAPTEGDPTVTGKATAAADFATAEALAQNAAVEAEPEPSEDAAAFYNPNIAVEPSEPRLSVTYGTESGGGIQPAGEAFGFNDATVIDTPALEDQAAEALQAGDHREAIRLYWQALNQDNQRADLWNALSQAYLLDGQSKNAETTARESMRLAPRDVSYTMDYLRITQQTKNPQAFLAELETAYDRFPRSSDLALSLARAYERIANDTINAREMYRTFLELAPNHPLRQEADQALRRLR